MNRVFSFDAETDGLYGRPFAIGAAVYEGLTLVDSFTGYLGPEEIHSPWVRENVLPSLANVPATHGAYVSMLRSFSQFYLNHHEDTAIIAHIPIPVEAGVIIDMRKHLLIAEFESPFPVLDVATILFVRGEDPLSVDDYVMDHQLLEGRPELEGIGPHNPLYDAIAAALAYQHLMGVHR